jgi:hypothetical protein
MKQMLQGTGAMPQFLRDLWRRLKKGSGSPAAPFIFAVPLTLVFITWPSVPLYAVADISLSGVLNEAHLKGLQWGKDFVGTYGPLGFLIFPCFSPHHASWRMVMDAVLCYTVAAGLCLLAWRMRLVWRLLLFGIFIFLLSNIDPRSDLVLNFALLFWGLLCLASSGPELRAYLSVFAVLAAFASLAKVSFLIWGGFSVTVVAADLCLRGNFRAGIEIALGFVASFVLGWLLAGQNAFHLGTFLLNALAVMEGYNETVGMQGLGILRQCGLVVFLLCQAAVGIRVLISFPIPERSLFWRRCLLFAWVSGFLFVSWKHGFLRADPWHMLFFFGFAPIVVLLLEALPTPSASVRHWARGVALAGIAVTLLCLQWFLFPPGLTAWVQPARSFSYNLLCLCKPAQYQTRMNDALASLARNQQLPKLSKLIGRASVDVFGFHQSYAILNGLNYCSRPVCQSAVATTSRLMHLNEQFYLSNPPPEYVLFDLFPGDHKLAPLEDGFLLRHLLINFEPVGTEYPFLLLRARSSIPAHLTLLREGAIHAGEPIELRPYGDMDLWLEIELKPTALGQLRRFFYKPSSVRLAAWSVIPGKRLAKQVAPAATMSAGFLASPLLLNNQDVMNLYANQSMTRPGSYSVELTAGEEHCWKPDIGFRVYKIQNRLGRCASGEALTH